jgi:hypothetical protein
LFIATVFLFTPAPHLLISAEDSTGNGSKRHMTGNVRGSSEQAEGQRNDYEPEARTRFWTTGNKLVNMAVWVSKFSLSFGS